MMGVQAAQVVDMQRHAGVIDEAAEKFDGQIDVERTDARARVLAAEICQRVGT